MLDTVVINHPERGPIWVGTNAIDPDRISPEMVVARFIAIRAAVDGQIERGDLDPLTRYYG